MREGRKLSSLLLFSNLHTEEVWSCGSNRMFTWWLYVFGYKKKNFSGLACLMLIRAIVVDVIVRVAFFLKYNLSVVMTPKEHQCLCFRFFDFLKQWFAVSETEKIASTRTVPTAHKRNALTALNVSIRKPHKAVPIPHPTPMIRLFTTPAIKNDDTGLCKCL